MYETDKTLSELGQEYLDNAACLNALIDKKRMMLSSLLYRGAQTKAVGVKNQIRVLKAMRRDMIYSGKMLIKNYPD